MDEIRYNRIQVVLFEIKIKQKELATILGVNKDTVSRWCNNIHQPSLEDLNGIAMALRIDICRFLEPADWSKEIGPSPLEKFKAAKLEAQAKRKKKSAQKRKRL